ncbi:hypothetical protein HK102_006799 [Quaeritorhiza haematococci]|nr:hypothetical protein HK102_006799 [Quaeritorhiza haematococci]
MTSTIGTQTDAIIILKDSVLDETGNLRELGVGPEAAPPVEAASVIEAASAVEGRVVNEAVPAVRVEAEQGRDEGGTVVVGTAVDGTAANGTVRITTPLSRTATPSRTATSRTRSRTIPSALDPKFGERAWLFDAIRSGYRNDRWSFHLHVVPLRR